MRIISDLFDFIFPPRAKEKLVREIKTLNFHQQYYHSHFALSALSDNQTRAAITENKFHHNQTAARLLARVLEIWLSNKTAVEHIVFIPVPLSRERMKERGHNQVVSILEQVKPTVQFETKILFRHRHTEPQTSLDKQKRSENIRGAFLVNEKAVINIKPESKIILIDDVVTTGATLNEARASLAPHLPKETKLLTLALAH